MKEATKACVIDVRITWVFNYRYLNPLFIVVAIVIIIITTIYYTFSQ